MPDIQKADPAARRIAMLMIVCGTIGGVLLLMGADRFRSSFEAWLQQDLRARTMLVVTMLCVVVTAPGLGVAWYLWRLGARVARSGRYPPPGLRVLHDTEIVTGAPAILRMRTARVLASVLALASVLLAFFIWRVVSLLLASSSVA